MKKFLNEFKEFAMGGDVINLAVGVIVGGAFNAIINSLVADIFVPALGLLFGDTGSLAEMSYNGIMYGNFISAIITFFLTSMCLFLFVKAVNTAKNAVKPEEVVEEAPAEPSEEIKLLTEIRDLLANK